MNKYEDIIDMPHHVSTTHKHMPIADRAAQFMPFVALKEHKKVVSDTEEIVKDRMNSREAEEDAEYLEYRRWEEENQ